MRYTWNNMRVHDARVCCVCQYLYDTCEKAVAGAGGGGVGSEESRRPVSRSGPG